MGALCKDAVTVFLKGRIHQEFIALMLVQKHRVKGCGKGILFNSK